MEMDNHMSDKDDNCYDNAEAAFSDDEEDLNSKGGSQRCLLFFVRELAIGNDPTDSPLSSLFLLPKSPQCQECWALWRDAAQRGAMVPTQEV